jgi:hypothetical protein
MVAFASTLAEFWNIFLTFEQILRYHRQEDFRDGKFENDT